MTQEKFRQWIVILLALALLTVWMKIGLKYYKWGKYCIGWEKHQMMMQQK